MSPNPSPPSLLSIATHETASEWSHDSLWRLTNRWNKFRTSPVIKPPHSYLVNGGAVFTNTGDYCHSYEWWLVWGLTRDKFPVCLLSWYFHTHFLNIDNTKMEALDFTVCLTTNMNTCLLNLKSTMHLKKTATADSRLWLINFHLFKLRWTLDRNRTCKEIVYWILMFCWPCISV